MGIQFNKTKIGGSVPTIWRGECKVLPGGFKPKQTFPNGTVIRRGALLHVDFSNMSAAIVKFGQVVSGGTTTKPRVTKGSYFAVGDTVTKIGDGNASPKVSAIDTSNEGYDVLTLSAAYSGLTAGDTLVESTDYGYVDAESGDEGALAIVANDTESPTSSQIKLNQVTPYLGEETLAAGGYVKLQKAEAAFNPNMVVAADKEFNGKGIPAIDAAYEAVVLFPSLTVSIPSEWKTGPCLKDNPNILFIRQ